MQRRQLLRLLGSLSLALAIGSMETMGAHAADKPLKVGVRGGVDEELWEVAAQVAKSRGLNVDPVVITGTASPNEALNNGDLDANSFQHIPFLRDQVKQRGYKIVAVADTLISPVAFYSKKYKSLEALPAGREDRFADRPEQSDPCARDSA